MATFSFTRSGPSRSTDHGAYAEGMRFGWIHYAALALVVALFLPDYIEQLIFVSDPLAITRDVRSQIWPYLRAYDSTLFQQDYLADYFLYAINPPGHRAFYEMFAGFVDPRVLWKFVTYLAFAVLVAALGVTAWRIAGPMAAIGVIAFTLGSDVYLHHMGGGFARTFGLPLFALALCGLVLGRPIWIAAATVVAAGFYYSAAAVGGLALAVHLLALPASLRGHAADWSLTKRLAAVVFTGFACAVIVLPSTIMNGQFGAVIGVAQWDAFPEAGLGGRFDHAHLPVLTLDLVKDVFRWTFYGFYGRDGWIPALRAVTQPLVGVFVILVFAAAAFGLLVLIRARNPFVLRALVFPAVALFMFVMAWAGSPYLFLPGRYLMFTIPLFMGVFAAAGLALLAHRMVWSARSPLAQPALAFGLFLVVMVLLGGRAPIGQLDKIPADQIATLDAVAALPKTAMIAGWPEGIIDNVPYRAARSVLVSHATHYPYHEKFLLELRRRTSLVLAAHFDDRAALTALRDDYRVTHFLLDREVFAAGAPTYFKPFGTLLQQKAAAGRPLTRNQALIERTAVFRDGRYVLLDLSKL